MKLNSYTILFFIRHRFLWVLIVSSRLEALQEHEENQGA